MVESTTRPGEGLPDSKTYLTEEAQIADTDPALKGFRRDPDGLDPLNAHLNYGYAILRAGVARALVSAGLFPPLGIHHRNRSNSFALADDLVEPFRPMIDLRVRDLHRQGRTSAGLDQPNKAVLLDVLHQTVGMGDQAGPLMVALPRYVASFIRCLRREEESLAVPVLLDQAD